MGRGGEKVIYHVLCGDIYIYIYHNSEKNTITVLNICEEFVPENKWG